MDVGKLYEFIVEMLSNWDSHRIAAFIVGVLAALFVAYMVFNVVAKLRHGSHPGDESKVRELLQKENFKLQKENEQLTSENLKLESNKRVFQERTERAKSETEARKRELAGARKQIANLIAECDKRAQSIEYLQEAKKEADQRCQDVKKEAEQRSQRDATQVAQLRNDIQTLKHAHQNLSTDRQARDAEIQLLKQKVGELSSECERLREETVDLDRTRHEVSTKLADVQASIEEAQAQNRTLQEEVDEYAKDFEAIANSDGKIWEQSVSVRLPAKTHLLPVISVLNLKGGVGKTTITANLGASLIKQGYRVLMLDLDYQGSLTGLCLSPSKIQDHVLGNRLVQQLFVAEARGINALWPILASIDEDSRGYIAAANDRLADTEMRIMSRWLLQVDDEDARFILRQTLHDPKLEERFDFILLDCPPRLTTACVNALTASDYVLIPTLLDKTSADAIPRLLEWLKHLKTKTGINMSILGVLANRVTLRNNELTSAQDDVWRKLPDRCQDVWGQPVYHFRALIKQDRLIAEAANDHRFAINNGYLESVFRDITNEMLRRMPHHEGIRTAAIH